MLQAMHNGNASILVIALIVGASLPAISARQGALDINFQGQAVGTVEQLRLVPSDGDSSKLAVHLTAVLPAFTETLDRVLTGRGNFLDRCSRRLLWVGRTSIRNHGVSLALSSRVRYEQWVCGFIKTRLLRDTKTVQWRLFVEPAPLQDLRISGQVENVVSLQNDLERALGLRVRQDIAIPLPASCGPCECAQITDALHPAFEAARFSDAGNGAVRIAVTFSVSNDLTGALQCLH